MTEKEEAVIPGVEYAKKLEYSWASIQHNNNALYNKAKVIDTDLDRMCKLSQENTNELITFKKELDLFPDVLNCIVDCKTHIEKLSFQLRIMEENLHRLTIIKKENDLKTWNANREKEEALKTKKKQDELNKTEKKLKKAFEDYEKKQEAENN